MGKYRKKPVVIEAVQWDGTVEGWNKVIVPWKGEDGDCIKALALCGDHSHIDVYIETLEGNMTVSPGDYIIKGVQGEFYPCKPDIFEQTYEKIE